MNVFAVLVIPNKAIADEPDWNTLIPIIIQIESNNNPYAVSEDGCIGLMQISDLVRREHNYHNPNCFIGKHELFNSAFNVGVGTWYLKRIWFHYLPHYELEQNLQNLCYAYNMGIGNLVKYRQGKIKLPKETVLYWKNFRNLYYHNNNLDK